MRRPLSLALTLPFLLAACSSEAASSDDPALAAMQAQAAGDHTAAVSHFDQALATQDKASQDYMILACKRLESLAHTSASQVGTELESLEGLTPGQYGDIASALLAASEFEEAAKTVKLGRTRLPEDPDMQQIETDIVAKVNSLGGDEGAAALKGLGYLGD